MTTIDELGEEAKEIVFLVQDQNLLNKAMSGQDIIDLLEGLKAITTIAMTLRSDETPA